MVNVEQLKSSVNRMSADVVRDAVNELRLDGLVTEGKTPFNKVHFNTCFAEIEALFQRAGFHRPLDVVGYQGLAYALYDASRWEAVEVLRWLKSAYQSSLQSVLNAPKAAMAAVQPMTPPAWRRSKIIGICLNVDALPMPENRKIASMPQRNWLNPPCSAAALEVSGVRPGMV